MDITKVVVPLIELFHFLDNQSVVEFSLTSSSFQKLFLPLIENNLTFCVPLSHLHVNDKFPQKFLKIYSSAQRFRINQPLLPGYSFSPDILPPSPTHIVCKNTSLKDLPLTLKHLYIISPGSSEASLRPNLSFSSDSLKLLRINSIVGERYNHYFEYNNFRESDKIWERVGSFSSLNSNNLCLKYLRPSNLFNGSVDNLPPTLTHLIFRFLSRFRREVEKLPPSLTHLKFGKYFDQDISNLPQSLSHLFLCGNFDQSMNSLPKSLTHLVVKTSETSVKYFHLPSSITHLMLPSDLSLALPPYLSKFSLYVRENISINGKVFSKYPPYLTKMVFYWHFNGSSDSLPPSLLKLEFKNVVTRPVDNLPPNLTHLIMDLEPSISIDYLPCSLTHLTLGSEFNQNVDYLPSSLTHLTLGGYFDQNIDYLPTSLKHLHISGRFKKPIDHLPSITALKIPTLDFNSPVDNLPNSLKNLYLGAGFGQPVNHLPPSLSTLEIGTIFSKFLHPVDDLPTSIKSLKLCDLTKEIQLTNFPHLVHFERMSI